MYACSTHDHTRKYLIPAWPYPFEFWTCPTRPDPCVEKFARTLKMRCGNSLITVREKIILFDMYIDARRLLDEHFCLPVRKISHVGLIQSDAGCHRSNESTDRCKEWNQCLSVTRLKDGSNDCLEKQDELDLTSMKTERSCARVQRHHFRCSAEQSTCLSVTSLGSRTIDCRNEFDHRWFGSGRRLSSMNCNERWKDDCFTLRQ